MSALVILECNACGAITPPWPDADRARGEAAPEGWAVDVDGSNVDYCQQCTAPAAQGGRFAAAVAAGHPSRVDHAREGIEQLRDALAGITAMVDYRPSVVVSVVNLARIRADQLLAELAS